MVIIWIFIGFLLIVVLYYALDFVINLFNLFFKPYHIWYEENKEHIIDNTEDLPGFKEWIRENQKKSLIVLCIIIFIIVIATWIFAD
jgi:hypothetical protein